MQTTDQSNPKSPFRDLGSSNPQSPFRDLGSRKWILPSEADGNAFMIRALKAEEHLKESLELLLKTKESIPQRPAQETKNEIHVFLKRFQ